jgi:hypothetical protein
MAFFRGPASRLFWNLLKAKARSRRRKVDWHYGPGFQRHVGVVADRRRVRQDLLYVDEIIDEIDADLCVDTRLRFATGFSFGGIMSYSLACLIAEKFRAVSVQSGGSFDAVIDGITKQNKGLGKAAARRECKKTDSFSSSFMSIIPSLQRGYVLCQADLRRHRP